MKIFYLIGSYDIAIRLSRAKTILFKVREFVNIKESIYYDIFDCHLMIFVTDQYWYYGEAYSSRRSVQH